MDSSMIYLSFLIKEDRSPTLITSLLEILLIEGKNEIWMKASIQLRP